VLLKPKQVVADIRLPALILVHGGPGVESRIRYDGCSFFANQGHVVYSINTGGSSGSGKTYFHLDDHAHGTTDLRDIVESKQMLVGLGYVDPDKIAIMSGSYEEYIALAVFAFQPEEFIAGVNIYGVANNWARTLSTIPPWWTSRKLYWDSEIDNAETQQAYLKSISPMFHTDKIIRLLIVLHGERDPRVKKIESGEIVKKVRTCGVPVEYVVLEDEGRGFRKKLTGV